MASELFAGKLPPQNLDAEISVLGAVLREPLALQNVLQLNLQPQHFYRTSHQHIFQALCDLYAQGKPPDSVLLSEELERRGELENAGGGEYLLGLLEQVPTAANAEHYGRIVRDKALLRLMIQASRVNLEEGYSSGDAVDEILDRAAQRLYEIAQNNQARSYAHVKDLVYEIFQDIGRMAEGGGGFPGVRSGYPDLDDITNGFKPGELVILAARPSVGKSTLASNMVLNSALEDGIPVLFFALEMERKQVVTNMLCRLAHVDVSQIIRGVICNNQDDMERLHHAGNRLCGAPIYIDDTPGIDLMQIRAKARDLVQRRGVRMVVVDYLQLMRGDSRSENRQQEISGISRGLKAVARDLEVPVVALAQLSRKVEEREKNVPKLSDLRESGAIEQDADMVMFLYREDYQTDEQAEPIVDAKLRVAKNRNGRCDTVTLRFFKQHLRFESAAPEGHYA